MCFRAFIFAYVRVSTSHMGWGGVGWGNNVHVTLSCYGMIRICGHALDAMLQDLLLHLHTHLALRHETAFETASS